MYLSVTPYIVVPTTEQLGIVTSGPDQEVYIETRENAVVQQEPIGLSSILGDHLLVGICDRDNTKLEGWVDNARMISSALTSDPDLSGSCRNYMFYNNAAARYVDGAIYRTILLSLTNGSTPTQAEWTEILGYMRNPDAPLHPLLVAAKGTVYSDYYCGEGLDGSATLEDQGDSGDDLTWQGENCEDVRYRAQVPRRKPRRTFYSLTPSYTAGTGNVDFGFSGFISVEFRVLFDKMGHDDHVGVEITNAAGTHYIRVERSGGVPRIAARAGGAVVTMNLSDDQLENGGDIAVGAISTTAHICLNGQLIGQLAMGASLNLSGDCQVNFDGDSRCTLIQVYEAFTTPGNFCDLICCTVQDPERTLLNMGTPLVDFPLNSDKLPLATSTTVSNSGSGGGTLTLSAQRSTSCMEVRTGYDP
jgi:hypothetical protein